MDHILSSPLIQTHEHLQMTRPDEGRPVTGVGDCVWESGPATSTSEPDLSPSPSETLCQSTHQVRFFVYFRRFHLS